MKIPLSWELFSSSDFEEIKKEALKLGWANRRVQVRKYDNHFIIEPFDGCKCPKIVPFKEEFVPNEVMNEG